jgi:imidazolonepropionase-like amidohydrolase
MRNSPSLSRALRCGLGILAAALALILSRPAVAQSARPLVIKAGRILTVTNGTIENGVLVIRNGKIAALGKQGEVALPPDAEIIDASGKWVMPGQVDLHTHIGNDSGLHDYVHSLNPAFRVWDYIDPESPNVKDSIASGISTILTIPGSGGNNSGFGVLWKLGGAKREDLILRRLGAIKIAQAYNPERHAGDLGLSRMGMWWMLREQFDRAKKYTAQWEAYERAGKSGAQADSHLKLASTGTNDKKAKQPPPPKTVLGLEQMRAVIEKKTPVFVHTAGARDVMETMRMFHDEMNLPVVISHGEFGGLREAEEAAKRNIPCNIGPRLYDFSFQTYDRRFYSIPMEYARAGVQNLSLNTDCPVIPSDDLFVQGTISVRMGMDEDLALRALTINPARAIGVGDRIGSLEVGKDADLVIKKGSLFDPRNPIEKVLINGKVVFTHGQKRKGVTNGLSLPLTDDDGCIGEEPVEDFLSHAR